MNDGPSTRLRPGRGGGLVMAGIPQDIRDFVAKVQPNRRRRDAKTLLELTSE